MKGEGEGRCVQIIFYELLRLLLLVFFSLILTYGKELMHHKRIHAYTQPQYIQQERGKDAFRHSSSRFSLCTFCFDFGGVFFFFLSLS